MTAAASSTKQSLLCLSALTCNSASQVLLISFVVLTPHAGATHAGNGPKVVKQLQWQQQLQQPLQAQPLLQQTLLQPPLVTQQQQQQQAPILSGPPPPAAPPALPQGPFSTGAPTATAPAAAVPRVGTLQHAGSLEGPYLDPPPTLWEFFYAEATPHEKYPTADVLWRQTERDRV